MANILIQPIIRLFGWSASDLSQYGDQPVGDIASSRVDDHWHPPTAHGEASGPAPVSERSIASVATGHASPVAPFEGPASAPVPGLTGSVHPATMVPPAAQGFGSGAGAPNPFGIVVMSTTVAHGVPTTVAHAAASPSTVIATDAPVTAPDGHAGAAMPVILATTGSSDGADHATHMIATTALPAVDPVLLPLTAPIAETAASLVHDIAVPSDAVAPLLAATANAVAPVVDHVAHLLDTPALTAAVAGLDDAATPTIAPVADAVAGVASLAAPLLAVTGSAIADVAAPLVHADLAGAVTDHFAGSDPAGGLQTLVGLVGSVDAFHIGPADATPAPAATMIDALADDHAVPTLLGIAGDHHDLHLGVIDSHHGLGLGL